MADSLQDQLLKAGLADTDKARKLAREKRKNAKVARRTGVDPTDETRELAKVARAEKVRRDRDLNQALNSKAQRKAINAQIKQLIEANKLGRGGGDIGFNFTDGRKVKKLYVNEMQQQQLAAGRLAVVKQGDQYELLPRPVADKIAERDAGRVIICSDIDAPALSAEEQDWYKDYDIPDDLMW